MSAWTQDRDDEVEWVRRAIIANRKYLKALMKLIVAAPVVRVVRPPFTPDALRIILDDVTAEYGVSLRQLQGKCRKRHLVVARRVVALRARDKGCSYPQIGRALNRDHTTILHHIQAMAA